MTESIREESGGAVWLQLKIRLVGEYGAFYGPGVEELLHEIEKNGSIQKACQAMGLSYSKGSRMVHRMEQQLGFPVVERWIGGNGGGGARLTEEGRLLMRRYAEMVRRVRTDMEKIYAECFSGMWKEKPEEGKEKDHETDTDDGSGGRDSLS